MPEPTQHVRVAIAPDHPAFAGHFPGRPLLPGVLLLAEAMEVLHAAQDCAGWVGDGAALTAVKFSAPVPPGAALEVRWSADAARRRVRFEVWRHGPGDAPEGALAASGQLEAAPADGA